jgi:hypothetical protein
MATTNGYRLWWDTDLRSDHVELAEPLGEYAYAWDEPVAAIAEVYIDGEPRLERARKLAASSGAAATIRHLREEVHA